MSASLIPARGSGQSILLSHVPALHKESREVYNVVIVSLHKIPAKSTIRVSPKFHLDIAQKVDIVNSKRLLVIERSSRSMFIESRSY